MSSTTRKLEDGREVIRTGLDSIEWGMVEMLPGVDLVGALESAWQDAPAQAKAIHKNADAWVQHDHAANQGVMDLAMRRAGLECILDPNCQDEEGTFVGDGNPVYLIVRLAPVN